ncbi:hypothetical protein SOASR014_35110 [Pectobacterium carotovorum subsp. carotovorum]|nr:Periplasmic dipeptide transport protein [Pectobacterium carotovorum subsp. carotovorum]GKX39772.1 hypothetical protein SOASR014_35110 [Pectobacterium carotovorum subsp. carotovorum]GLX46000.1 hypothetical protein Pcaca01_36680 [Pectobacterium carotovorum subsp. carotovorum]
MKKAGIRLTLAALTLAVASAASANTLVYCSEGSPENFNPQLYTSGTSVDASAVPIYNRLVDFKVGTTELVPSLAERWDISADGRIYTFHLRKGVKFQSSNRRVILPLTTLFSPSCGKKIRSILTTASRKGPMPILKACPLAR